MASIFLIKHATDRPIAVGGKIRAVREARNLSTQQPKRIVEVIECLVAKMPPKQLYAALLNNKDWCEKERRLVAFRSGFEIIGWGMESFEPKDEEN